MSDGPDISLGYRHLTPAEFRSNHEDVNTLRSFLQSPAGVKLVRVLDGMDPLAKLTKPEALDENHVRGTMVLQVPAEPGLLNLSVGYNYLKNLLTQVLTVHTPTPTAPKTRREGAPSFPEPQRAVLP